MRADVETTPGSVAAATDGRRDGDDLFVRLLGGHLLAAALAGLALLAVPVPPRPAVEVAPDDGATFRVSPNAFVRAEPVVAAVAEPADLVVADAVPMPEPAAAQPEAVEAPPSRRVYGTRRVLARGLGADAGGGSLVVRHGNTVDGRPDTLTATAADLREAAASPGAVTSAPVPVHRVKPEYSAMMREHRVSGLVSARLLIDSDGRVARIEIIEDCGFDSRDLATAAFARFRFEPALREGTPVAVWIVHKISFEFQE